ncbi:tyrosine-protein phosphatase [Dietzia aurantiaca]|uniref:tyrosine-protein phosphatase n=1 Tax=Dietzia aurantiaca TaxID=983873 RepID=UPI001E453C76|nr:tyrosine-protein phosphatase [Dietzia aurantiaca]MCD2264135.1 tyrosine-protein phosphatase [Dietzia aurantiaca]
MVAKQDGSIGMDVGGGDDDTAVRSRIEGTDGVVTLSGIHNFRDVAGPGYPVAPSGAGSPGAMARGIVFRSAAISATDGDVDILESLDVTTIVDLRTEGEVAQQPDVPVPGARNVQIDILQGNSTAATLMNSGIVTVEEARSEMARTYERFVVGDDERAAFGRAISAVAASTGTSIVHCTAGKDRTGWTSAILQLLAGVSEEDVVADYLLTQNNTAELTAAIMQYVRVKMPHQADAIEVLMGVEEANIRRSLEALAKEFGDIRRYLVEGAGMDGEAVDALGARLRS